MSRLIALMSLLGFLFCLTSCSPQATVEPTPTTAAVQVETVDAKPFIVGDVGDDVDEIVPFLQPLADYIAANLEGYTHGEVAIAPDLDTMADMLENGDIDLYLDSAYPIVIVSRQSGSRIVLRQWARGVSEYHSVFFALESSDVDSISDLNGRLVAFDTPYSTSGYFLPAHYLLTEGHTITEVTDANAQIPEDAIGYIFSSDDSNTVDWVISGRVAAGVTDSTTYSDIPAATRDRLVILAETENMPRRLASVRPGMSEDVQASLIEVLSTMSDTEAGRAVLEHMRDTNFDLLPQGIDTFTEQIYAMLDAVEGS
jgi:phosphonate transport system substrate-binding protein